MDPITAGSARLIIQSRKVESIIPRSLSENIPIKNKDKEPLIPNSAISVVGIKVLNK